MKTCVKCKISKIESEFYLKSKARDKLTSRCKSCSWLATKSSRSKNKEKYIKDLYEWRKKNPAKVAAIQRAWHVNNPIKSRANKAKWSGNNRDKVNSGISKWKKLNTEKVASYNGKRRAVKLSATPQWTNEFFIEEIYDLARRRTALNSGGHKWHVDHIVPLKSDLVCGLHVEHNLQVIPALVNARKHNRHWPDMPGSFEV